MADIWMDEIPNNRRILDKDSSSSALPKTRVVLHTTGSGVLQKAMDAGHSTDEAQAAYACKFYANVMAKVSTHLLVDARGNPWQMVALNRTAWHAGWSKGSQALYGSKNRAEWKTYSRPLGSEHVNRVTAGNNYAEWQARYPNLQGPVEMLPSGAKSPNDGSVSIDFLAYPYGKTYPDAQLEGVARLILRLETLFSTFKAGPSTVYQHSDVDPVNRGCVSVKGKVIEKAWDPGIDVKALLARIGR